RFGEREAGVRQDRKWQVQPLRRLALIGAVLRRQPEQRVGPKPLELGEMIADAARLRRAAARARDRIPAGRQRLPGPSRARIDIDYGPARKLRQVHLDAVSRRK